VAHQPTTQPTVVCDARQPWSRVTRVLAPQQHAVGSHCLTSHLRCDGLSPPPAAQALLTFLFGGSRGIISAAVRLNQSAMLDACHSRPSFATLSPFGGW
jgi:hypothetical protein